MRTLQELVRQIIRFRSEGVAELTLLAVCPNSEAVLEAAVKVAAANNAPMLFAATLNQVDRDGGYTGWTQQTFVEAMKRHARQYGWDGPLYPCLDHGGPWLKDLHTLHKLSFDETMREVKASLIASLEAGYRLLHIDPTVDRTLPAGGSLPIDVVIDRTVELIAYAEAERQRLGIPHVDYEVGTEEVHGGLVDLNDFEQFVKHLREELKARDLMHAWPCFFVAQVGTDLHTTFFEQEAASRLYDVVAPLGALIKGHYTDWVENPGAYPEAGMGGANVGPEFTAEEYHALVDLAEKERALCRYRPERACSNFLSVLEQAVIDSDRWEKWLQPDEEGLNFAELTAERRTWLVQTGARYVWAKPAVVAARDKLYNNLRLVMPNPHQYVVDRIVDTIDRYINAFNLFDALTLFREH